MSLRLKEKVIITSRILGLVPGHAYSILRVKEIEHKQRGKIKILKLRNPWAKKEWT